MSVVARVVGVGNNGLEAAIDSYLAAYLLLTLLLALYRRPFNPGLTLYALLT